MKGESTPQTYNVSLNDENDLVLLKKNQSVSDYETIPYRDGHSGVWTYSHGIPDVETMNKELRASENRTQAEVLLDKYLPANLCFKKKSASTHNDEDILISPSGGASMVITKTEQYPASPLNHLLPQNHRIVSTIKNNVGQVVCGNFQ